MLTGSGLPISMDDDEEHPGEGLAMRATGMAVRSGGVGWCPLLAVAGALGLAGTAVAAEAGGSKPDAVAVGREVFNREWLPDDARGHGGDGLGPVYNDTSCVACHNLGGPGGAGPVGKNIDILSASRNLNGAMNGGRSFTSSRSDGRVAVQRRAIAASSGEAPTPPADLGPLVEFHAGFRAGRTVALHRFGSDPNYEAWRLAALGMGPFANVGMPAGGASFSGMSGSMGGMGMGGFRGRVTMPFNRQVVTAEAPATVPADRPAAAAEPAGAFASDVPVSGPAAARGEGDADSNRDDLPGENGQVRQPFQAATRTVRQAQQGDPDAARMQRAMQMASLGHGANVGQRQLQIGEFTVARSQRNPTPLFGLGLIDAIPETVIEEAAAAHFAEFPEVQGRVSRLKGGRVGRLGWKGQTASSEDFVLTACAVELGLEVPGHEQATLPQAPKYKAGGLDLSADECAALVAFVRDLPPPVERKGATREESKALAAGKAAFNSVGCASCHAAKLGAVEGIYSDLLLHDMGPSLADQGSYNGSAGDETEDGQPVLLGADGRPANPPKGGATRQEWRTPPLWGVRDSGPYLHDGRAETIDQAVAQHGGQGAASAQRYFKLPIPERRQVEAFLKTLVAPPQLARAGD